jgi:hypothetical protein
VPDAAPTLNERIANLEAQNRPIEPADKQRLEAMEGRLASNPHIKTLTAAEMEYMDLLRQVNAAVQGELAREETSAGMA